MTRTMLLAAVAAAGLAFGGAAGAQEPVRLGFSIAQTGLFASAAAGQLAAYELWRDEVNAAGGLEVGGERRPVEFVSYDDQSDPGQAVRIYEKLITDDEVDLLLAPWGTPTHIAVAGVLERYGFPMVGNSAASVQLRELAPGNIFFPTSAIPDRMAAELVKLMQSQDVHSVAVTTLQLPFSLEIKQYLIPALEEAGLEVAVDEEYSPGVKDLTSVLTEIKAAGPDAVVSLSYPEDSILYMNQAREIGIDAPFQFVMVGPTLDFFPGMFGDAANGIVTIGHWSPFQAQWPKAKPFYDAYVAKYGTTPDYLDAALAYTSLEILQQAVAKAGLDHDALREELSTDTFDTINGPVRFEGVENAVTPTMFLQLQQGQAHIVWPPELSTAPFLPKGS